MRHFDTFRHTLKHSVSDWDFETTDWELSTAKFISSPTAIRSKTGALTFICSRLAEAQVLSEGRMVANINIPAHYGPFLNFRNQAALGSADHVNCYFLQANPANVVLFNYYLDLASINIGQWSADTTLDTWLKYRLTWWNGVDLMNNPALAIELEVWEAGAWASKGILYDPHNRWTASNINRCGPVLRPALGYHDDTEIWVPL